MKFINWERKGNFNQNGFFLFEVNNCLHQETLMKLILIPDTQLTNYKSDSLATVPYGFFDCPYIKTTSWKDHF